MPATNSASFRLRLKIHRPTSSDRRLSAEKRWADGTVGARSRAEIHQLSQHGGPPRATFSVRLSRSPYDFREERTTVGTSGRQRLIAAATRSTRLIPTVAETFEVTADMVAPGTGQTLLTDRVGIALQRLLNRLARIEA